jgi:hypothetical protein
MPDLSPQSPQPHVDRTAGSNGEADGDEALHKLHRMSRTAGLGTQEYVAINVAAVMTLLLGLASALAMVTSLLLVIPVAGVVCGIVALYQIKDSNGTQTGKGIAWTGIALSVLFAALVGGRVILENVRTRADRDAVVAAVAQFGQKLSASDFKGAYEMLSPRMRERVPLADFEGQMKARYAHPMHGKITSFTSTGRVLIESDPETKSRFAQTQAVITVEHGEPDRPQLVLAHEPGGWMIEAWPWFQTRPNASPSSPAP